MKTTLKLALFIAITFGALSKQASCIEPTWKLQVNLIDDSRVVGIPENRCLKVDVGFDEVEIPIALVRRAEWRKDRKTVRVELQNRDILTGKVIATPIKMSTLFGHVVLNMDHIRSLEVVPTNRLGWLPSERDLVLYYSFDEDDGNKVVNLAADNLHGKAKNLKWLAEGRRGGAIEFDGAGMIEVSDHGLLRPTALTLAMWIYPTGVETGYEMIAAKTDPGSWHKGYGFVRSSGSSKHLQFFVNSYSGNMARAEVPRATWSHLAGVFNGHEVIFYLNGEPVARRVIPGGQSGSRPEPFGASNPRGEDVRMPSRITHSSSPLWIGRDQSGYTWKGKMDELVMYGRALNSKEVALLYQAAKVE